jgi:regulatory protein
LVKITAITQQQGRKDRFSVFADGVYIFSLSQAQYTDMGLRVGDEVSPEQLANFLRLSEVGKALDVAYRFLSYRFRSRQEMILHLKSKRYDASLIDEVIQALESQDLLNDVRFANEWIANRQLLNPRSHRELKAELRQKGVSSEAIENALTTLEPDAEEVALEALMSKKKLRSRYADQRKLVHYLSAKGFSNETIRKALQTDEEEFTI